MKAVEDWRRVLALSLSFWAQIAGLLVLIVPEARFALTGKDYNPYVAWWLGVLLLLVGLIGRLVRQTDSTLREWLRILGVFSVAAALAVLLASKVGAGPVSDHEVTSAAAPFVIQNEAIRLVAYMPTPNDVPTICVGHTEGVRMGDTAARDECLQMLASDLDRYWQGIKGYLSPQALSGWMPVTRAVGTLDLTYNCGIWAIGHSTHVRLLNVGDIRGACQAMTWWNKQGQHLMRGLVARRSRDYKLCMVGV